MASESVGGGAMRWVILAWGLLEVAGMVSFIVLARSARFMCEFCGRTEKKEEAACQLRRFETLHRGNQFKNACDHCRQEAIAQGYVPLVVG